MSLDQTASKGPILKKLIILTLLLLTLVSTWWFTSIYPEQQSTTTQPLSITRCDFVTAPCITSVDEKTVSLTLNTTTIASFTPMDFIVTLEGFDTDTVEIDFQGIEMFMGSNFMTLEKKQNSRFEGSKTLPGHSDQSMTWRAIVTMKDNNQQQSVWFEFELE